MAAQVYTVVIEGEEIERAFLQVIGLGFMALVPGYAAGYVLGSLVELECKPMPRLLESKGDGHSFSTSGGSVKTNRAIHGVRVAQCDQLDLGRRYRLDADSKAIRADSTVDRLLNSRIGERILRKDVVVNSLNGPALFVHSQPPRAV